MLKATGLVPTKTLLLPSPPIDGKLVSIGLMEVLWMVLIILIGLPILVLPVILSGKLQKT